MSCRSEGESDENQRPELIAARSSMVRIGSSMGLYANFSKVDCFTALSPSGSSGLYQVSLARQERRNTFNLTH